MEHNGNNLKKKLVRFASIEEKHNGVTQFPHAYRSLDMAIVHTCVRGRGRLVTRLHIAHDLRALRTNCTA